MKKPYGLWPSPLTTKALAGTLRLMEVAWAGEDQQTLVWLEGRSGQNILVAQTGTDAPHDLISDHSAKGGVGYGGGEFGVHQQTVYFGNKDGRLFKVDLQYGKPKALTPKHGSVASPTPSPDGQWVAYVHTDHHNDVIALVDANGQSWPQKFVSGADFYMQPTWSPDGKKFAWVAWDHPQMPWDGARIEIAEVYKTEDGRLALKATQVIAGDENTSVQQPVFSPNGTKLAYTSDASGFIQIHVRDLLTGEDHVISDGGADHATPPWIQGRRTIAWTPDGQRLIALRFEAGRASLRSYTLGGQVQHFDHVAQYGMLEQLSVNAAGQVALIVSDSTIPARIVRIDDLEDQTSVRICKRASSERLPQDALASMQPVSWQANDGTQVFGNYYAPTSPNVEGIGLPPLLVMIHGGPTSQSTATYNARSQFFATRGFAVLEVNYRGSTGYGRKYMDALKGQWGILDVEDAIGGAQHLVDEGLVDKDKLVIMGGSAGGYTVFQALTDHPGFFAAGISMYGITNLFSLTASTHKFESRYNDSLLGVLPKDAQLFKDRSPFFKSDKLRDPIAIFQGAKDVVVPKDQADVMVEKLRAQKVPHVYHVYENEGHGWRSAETIEHFYKAVLDFLTNTIIYAA